MMKYNQVPENDDKKIIKAIAFPFQKGIFGLPAMVKPENYIYTKIISLLTTSPGERVLNVGFGVNLTEYVFTNMTPIQRVRIANAVSNAIEKNIPEVRVNSVDSHIIEDNSDSEKVVFDIIYTVGNESHEQQVIYIPTTMGE